MLSLRVALLLAGIALVAIIWLWGRRGRRGRYHVYGARPSAGRRRLRRREPALVTSATKASDAPAAVANGEPGPELPRILGEPRIDPVAAPVQRSQMELSLESQPRMTQTESVLVINVEVAGGRAIQGGDLLHALRTVGMQHGAMQIFHHFGVGQLRAAEPLFSLANLFEPGVFDLATMDTLRTRGMSLFMRLPAPVDSKVAFELMLNTAERLADILGAQLTDHRHRPLTAPAVESLRAQAAGGR